MSSQHQVALVALKTLLLGVADLTDPNQVFIGRRRAVSAAVQRAIVLRLERSASKEASVLGGRTSWGTLISIECYGRDDDGAEPGSVADGVMEQVFAVLDQAPSLCDGFCDIEPLAGDTLAWDYDDFDKSMACVTARFVMKHQTTGRTLIL